jgi:arginine utilization regulatory protein
MIRRYVEQIFNIFNYVDGVVVTDENAIIQYYKNSRPDLNNLQEKDVLGKHVLDVYVSLDVESSSILRVLRNGKPIPNEHQIFTNCNGQIVYAINTTLPIFDKGKLVGAVDVSSYERQGIMLSIKNHNMKKLYTLDDIMTVSPNMLSLKDKISKISDTDSSVMIVGETGTGKELVAQSLYTSSSRKNKKFISQNCAAIPSTLLESILFGTVKGSFTGSMSKPGLFEIANGGVLFLDEINSMELNIQPKILKAVEEKRITRVGGEEQIEIDVKIISALNEDPIKCIKENKLREDLFYRLGVVQLHIPPLRERIDDLNYLIKYFIKVFNNQMNKSIVDIDEEVEKIFKSYQWPGNIRELKNVIEGAFNLTSSNLIQKKDLPAYIIEQVKARNISLNIKSKGFSLQEMVEKFECEIIDETIKNSSNYADAAKKLKISKQALNYKLNKYSLNK